MAKGYVPIFFDWLETTQDLTAENKGDLIDAVILYATGKEYDHLLLDDRVRICFRFLKGQVDRNEKISVARSEARKNKTEQNRTFDNKTQQNQTNENKPEQTKTNFLNNNNNKNNKENKKENNNDNKPLFEIDEEFFHGIQRDHDALFQAAENAGFGKTETERTKIVELYEQFGKGRCLEAIDACATYGKPSVAYMRGVLTKSGSQKPQGVKPVCNPYLEMLREDGVVE